MIPRHLKLAGIAIALLGTATSMAETLEWPRLGQPAVIVPGGLLEVGAREEGTLSLEKDGGPVTLNTNWSSAPGAIFHGRATVPEGIAPGIYTLQLDSHGGVSTRKRAVHVLAEIPQDYAVAVVRGARPTEGDVDQSPLPEEFRTRLNEAEVQMVLILGPLTRSGTEIEYQALETLISGIDLPVYLCPDKSDLRTGDFFSRFGNPIHGVSFGRDGYLFLGAGLPAEDSRVRASLVEAHAIRRNLRASRWSIGVAGRFGLEWDLRTQIALFVDDPLNALIAGSVAPGLGATVPWGKTAFVLPAEGTNEAITVVSVTATGIRPRKAQEPEQAPTTDQVEAPVE